MGAVSLTRVRSYGGDGNTGMQDPSVVEPSVEVLCVEEPSGFLCGGAGSSGELKPELHWLEALPFLPSSSSAFIFLR
jgi:hypothetical protein